MPLSITTVPAVEGRDRPYADELSPDNLLAYRYRGSDPAHRDNVALRVTTSVPPDDGSPPGYAV